MTAVQKIFKRFFIILQITLLACCLTLTAKAQGEVDASFNPTLTKDSPPIYYGNLYFQPDGKIIVYYSTVQSPTSPTSYVLKRLNADGSTDTTFSCSVCGAIYVNNVLFQPNGKIIVNSYQTVNGRSLAAAYRLNSDGSQDSTFNAAFPSTQTVYSGSLNTALQPDGKILFLIVEGGGNASQYSLIRLNADGSLDTSFTRVSFAPGFNLVEVARKVLVQPDGKVIVLTGTTGNSSTGGGTIKRFNSDGSTDSTFEPPIFQNNSGVNNRININDIELLPDGRILAVGQFTIVNGSSRINFVKLGGAGNVDTAFDPANSFVFNQYGQQVKLLSNGQIMVSSLKYEPLTSQLLEAKFTRFNADGSIDNSFTSPSNLTTFSNFKIDSANRVVFFGTIAGVARYARLNLDGSLDTTFNPAITLNGSVTVLAPQSDGKVVFAGDFSRVNGVEKNKFGRVNGDGSLDTTFNSGSGFDVTPSVIKVQPDAKILAIGDFTSYNGVARANFLRLNSDGTLDTAFNPAVSNVTSAAIQADGKIVIGGTFSNVNGVARTAVARLNNDGSLDNSFNPVVGSASIILVFAQADGKIIIGGSFTGVNGFSRVNLARLNADGTTDATFNAGNISSISSLFFQQSDGKYLLGLSRLNYDGTADTTFQTPSISGNISSILPLSDGTILIGGSFTAVNGVERLRLAKLRADGTLGLPFINGGANGQVNALARQNDGKFLIGGSFSTVGNVARSGLARITYTPVSARPQFDFDGDGKSDIAVFRPSNGFWYMLRSADNTFSAVQFGQAGDQIAPADYDGDGKTDVAVFREAAFAYFYILNSADNSFRFVQFGTTGDVPMTGDWDGDGKGDLAVYRAATTNGGQSNFYYRPTNQPTVDYYTLPLGTLGDKPVRGDFDGDGRLDPAVFRPSNSNWTILRSSLNQITTTTFGLSTDIPAPADYDGDGAANIAVFRPSNGTWYTSQNPTTNYGAIVFGVNGDTPIAADYDGDGRADAAVFRSSTGAWYLQRTTSGFTGVAFGQSGDKPIPNAYIR